MSSIFKGLYLAAFTALHPDYDITYQDINGKRDIAGDMLDVDLKDYDFIIATPPCNYWSRANRMRDTSEYALKTKYLLPSILTKLCNQNKPFIVENVRNSRLFKEYHLYDFNCYIYEFGRHTYWTNIMFNPTGIKQVYDFTLNGKRLHSRSKMQGGDNVHKVIEYWLDLIHN